MKFAKKLLVLCAMMAMICVPAYAEEEVIVDTSLLMFGSANLTVYVDGEVSNSLSNTYIPYDVVTVQAPDVTGKTFNYWANNEGNIISYNKELTLNIYANTVLNAVYSTGTVTAQPAAEFLSITRTSSQIMFNVIATAPSDNSVTEYGIRYSTTKNTLDGLKGNDGVTAEKAAISDTNCLFGVTASDNTTYYVTAYVISGGNTYYSDVKTVSMSDLDEGVTSVAAMMDLLVGESFVSNEIQAAFQSSLFAVNFDANKGTGTMPPQGFMKNTPTALNANIFTRSYYTFNGWNTKADGTGTSYSDGAEVSLTGSITFYAQWKPIQYVISYDLQGGTNNAENPATYTIESPTITLKAPTKTNYDFVGWTCNGESITEIAAGSTGDKILMAVWKVIESANPASPANTPGASDDPATPGTSDTTNPGTSDSTQVSADVLSKMTDEEIANTLGSKTEISLTGSVDNLSEIVTRLETLTNVKTLDLSQVTGATELKLEQTTLENITLEGNQSIKNVEMTASKTLTTLNLSRSKVETVNVEGCENLVSINVEGAENLTVLNINKTNIAALNVKNCAKLEKLDAKGCSNLEEVNLEGCQSLEYLDVSETAITKLDTSNCEKLSSINCSSCDISELNIDGCKKLADLNCANNSLSRLDVSGFSLNSLECQHQTVKGFIRRASFNILDILFRRLEAFITSEENDASDLSDVANVKDVQAFDENGEKIDVEFNDETGEVNLSKEPATIQYNYITGFKDVSMDVTVETSGESTAKTVGSSGSGCNAGFFALALLLLTKKIRS
ncbi:MAG: InlB B-repeat-containing protein [Synergistaceae bacterium]|nr:InlB B-repeat-containing protein [Synergistaceae bacterium]